MNDDLTPSFRKLKWIDWLISSFKPTDQSKPLTKTKFSILSFVKLFLVNVLFSFFNHIFCPKPLRFTAHKPSSSKVFVYVCVVVDRLPAVCFTEGSGVYFKAFGSRRRRRASGEKLEEIQASRRWRTRLLLDRQSCDERPSRVLWCRCEGTSHGRETSPPLEVEEQLPTEGMIDDFKKGEVARHDAVHPNLQR